MDQTAHDTRLREILQIFARLAKACAAHEHRPEKFPVYDVIKQDIRRCNVTAAVRGGELDSEPLPTGVKHAAENRLDRLYLYQRDSRPPCLDIFE